MSQKNILKIAQKTKEASYELSQLSSAKKNKILKDVAVALKKNTDTIIKSNIKDVKAAKKKKISAAMIDRLVLDKKRISGIAKAVLEIVALKDPVGDVVESRKRSGLSIKKVRIPLGVICMIYESRPNVTIDAASLCFKSGNAVILRGGSEAFHSNKILLKIFSDVLKKHKISPQVVSMVPYTDRKAMIDLLQLDQLIDVVIPRGGEGLMKFIGDHTRVPVIKHDKGVCSLFIDETADLKKAVKIVRNAKVQRPGVCNALETLYVHQKIAPKFLPDLHKVLHQDGVEIRGDTASKRILPGIQKAKRSDFGLEYLDLILAIKVVKNVNDAIANVIEYSSNHTDGIVSKSKKNIDLFSRSIHSSCIMINTSTRFNDGGELGLGAEIGISTTKLHAYGPMGLKELTTTKYLVESNHRIRQ